MPSRRSVTLFFAAAACVIFALLHVGRQPEKKSDIEPGWDEQTTTAVGKSIANLVAAAAAEENSRLAASRRVTASPTSSPGVPNVTVGEDAETTIIHEYHCGHGSKITPSSSWRQSYDGILVVIFVAYLPNLDANHIELFRALYSAFQHVVFYADLNDCHDGVFPCTGDPVDQSRYPEEVRWLPELGGGWHMQKALLHAIREEEHAGYTGYLFVPDDAFLRYPDLISLDQDAFWIAPIIEVQTLPQFVATIGTHSASNEGEFVYISRIGRVDEFYDTTSDEYRTRIRNYLGQEDAFARTAQGDFFYVPGRFASSWSDLCQQMTDFGLAFPLCFTQAVLGVADSVQVCYYEEGNGPHQFPRGESTCGNDDGDVITLRTAYSNSDIGARAALDASSPERFIHPLKFSSEENANAACAYIREAAERIT